MKALTREAILDCSDLETEKVEIPQWGGYVFVRSLTGKERDDFESSCVEIKGKRRETNLSNIRAKLVSLTTVDSEGKRLFSESDVAELGSKNAGALDAIFSVAQRLSGLSEKDVNDLAKNSHPDQS